MSQQVFQPQCRPQKKFLICRYNYFPSISANIIAIVLGTILGWSSPSIRKLKAPDSPVGPINDNEDSWISSLMPLAAAVGPIAAGKMLFTFRYIADSNFLRIKNLHLSIIISTFYHLLKSTFC